MCVHGALQNNSLLRPTVARMSKNMRIRQNFTAIDAKIQENWRITQRELIRQIGVDRGTVNSLIKNVDYWWICVKQDQNSSLSKWNRRGKTQLNTFWHVSITMVRDFSWILWRDESWTSYYNTELKEQLTEYHQRSTLWQRKVWAERSTAKVMLSIFWYSERIVHEFHSKGCKVNSGWYIRTLRKLKQWLWYTISHHPVFLLQYDNQRHTNAATMATIK